MIVEVPVSAQDKITARLNELIAMGERVLATRGQPDMIGTISIDTELSTQWATSSQSLLGRAFGRESAHYVAFASQIERLTFNTASRAVGVLRAAAEDLAGGHLFELTRLVEADLFNDFLEQAEHLLETGYQGPAAVIAGCVLEDTLRKLCATNSIEVLPTTKLDKMNSELAKAAAYSKLVQKQITSNADLRNKAAHARWDEFSADDVADMLRFVRRFVEKHAS